MYERFVARVVDVNDPQKESRVKIRIYGLQDDTTRIPDSDLPWARCVFPVTNPVNNGTAGPTTGLIKNSTVVGYWADDQRQIPLIDGSLGGANSKQSDFPKADRGEDFNEVLGKHLPSIGASEIKYGLDKTIGSIQFVGQDIGKMLSEIGQGDIFSAIQQAKDVIRDFNYLKNSIVGSTIDQVNGIVQGFVSDANHAVASVVESVVPTTIFGNVISTPPVINANPQDITNTINNLAGNIATRTSKTPITTPQDALTRVSGSTFVMGNIMPHLDAALNRLKASKK